MSGRPKVFTIPAGAPFLPVLADALLSGRLAPLADHPLALADATILLPTRRAVRAFRDILAARLGGAGLILPRIRPIGDVDEEDHLLAPAFGEGAEQLVLPEAISPLARRLALTRLTLAWGRAVRRELLDLKANEPLLVPASAADATRLAADLARLIDDMATAGKSFDAIARLVPDDAARYFQITLDFLKIAGEAWPAFLAERNVTDPAARRDRLVRMEAGRLAACPPSGPVIAAGSTGSIPATAALLGTISRLPMGAVVLPGLDRDLDDAGWQAIGGDISAEGHPQYGLKRLLHALETPREAVETLGEMRWNAGRRVRLFSEALRPAATTDAWAAEGARFGADAVAGIDLIVARNEQEEALAIAIALREALQDPKAVVALVTPDRTLARRVAVELGRWNVAADDSAGAPLDRLPAGIFARLLVEAVSADGDPVSLLAMLKHPHASFGMGPFECRRAARMLEIAIFRGRRVPGGLAALEPALAVQRAHVEKGDGHVPRTRRRLRGFEWNDAGRLVEAMGAALGALEAALSGRERLTAAHAARLLLDALEAATADESGSPEAFWESADGAALAGLLDGLVADGEELDLAPGEFPAFLAALMGDVSISRPAGADPRVHVWGTLEARLQSVDLLVAGGLDEGIWPAATRTDPWLSRPRRTALGLPPPERRIGLAAHDFVEAAAAPRVVLTRAEKRGGTPTVASRWLQRLAALLDEAGMKEMTERGARFVTMARNLDSAGIPRPVRRPAPAPPLAARPRGLSVTEIETLIRDPYAIYAKHVLKLEELEPPGRPPDFALRGSLMHQAIGDFIREWQGPFDERAEARLRELGAAVLAEIADFPDIHAIWSLRFAGIARWIIDFERNRDGEIEARHAEIAGRAVVAAPTGEFVLRGRADRIDRRKDGTLDILDYKTGTPPTATQVLVGFAPQLGLEAAMVRQGAFDEGFRGASIANLAWIGLSKVERGRPFQSAVERDWTADAVADRSWGLFTELVGAFDDPAWAYRSRTRPMFEQRYESPYDHLARVREWGLVESEEDILWLVQPQPKP
jgi:ATP-dependent helicase/nuclease subunit B